MKYCIDTSVIVKFYLEEENSEKADELLRQAILKEIELVAPSLLYYEVNGVFANKGFSKEKRDQYFQHLLGLVQTGILNIINPDGQSLEEAYDMANYKPKGLGHISVYDATFHALALKEEAVFLTADGKHADKTEKQFGSVLRFDDLVMDTNL